MPWRDRSHAGVSVTTDSAIGLPAVYRCQSINSDIVSSLPISTYVKQGTGRGPGKVPVWVDSPNDEMSFPEFLGQLQTSLEQDGNAFALKAATPRRGARRPLSAGPAGGTGGRAKTSSSSTSSQQLGGEEARIEANEMLHIRGFTLPGALRGSSPIIGHERGYRAGPGRSSSSAPSSSGRAPR